MSLLFRTSLLALRHAALESGLEDWNDMCAATPERIPFFDPTKSRTQI